MCVTPVTSTFVKDKKENHGKPCRMYRGMRNKKLQLVTVSVHNRTNILEIKILVGLPISSILSRFFSQASIQLRPSTNIPDTLSTSLTEIVLLVFTVCGSYLTEDSDNFSSSRNPISDALYFASYEETRCQWNIKPKSDTSIIWLTFAELSLGYRYDGYCG